MGDLDVVTEGVLLEGSVLRTICDIIILVLIVVCCVIVPFQAAFRHIISLRSSLFIYILDLFFLADIVLNFRTSFRLQGIVILDKKQIKKHYIRGLFFVDLIALLPIDAIFLGRPEIQIWQISAVLVLRGIRLLRILRLHTILLRWERQSQLNPGYLRIMKFIITIVLLIHVLACIWFLASYIDGFPSDSWATIYVIADSAPREQYVRSLYWTVTTMTTVGYGDIIPHRQIEWILSIIVMLLGASMYAMIIGNVASIFSNLDSLKTSFWHRIESATGYLRYRKVPQKLNDR